MNRYKLMKIYKALDKVIKDNDPNKDYIYAMNNKSEEWLNKTYTNLNKFSKKVYKELLRVKNALILDIGNLGNKVTTELMRYYLEHYDNLLDIYDDTMYKHYIDIVDITLDDLSKIVAGANVGIDFQLLDEEAKIYLMNKKIQFARQVSNSTHDAIVSELSKGFELGESIPDLSARIANMPAFNMARATLVSRTEVVNSSNAGTFKGYELSGVVVGKEWVSIGDSRTRDIHLDAIGQRRALKEPFIVGGEKLMHPGDSSLGASAGNVIQCRCSTIPIFDGEVI